MSTTFAQDIAQMMADWNAATPEQRAEALKVSGEVAHDAERRGMLAHRYSQAVARGCTGVEARLHALRPFVSAPSTVKGD